MGGQPPDDKSAVIIKMRYIIIKMWYFLSQALKFVNISFPQCNVYTGFQGGCLAVTPLGGYLRLSELTKFIGDLKSYCTEIVSQPPY